MRKNDAEFKKVVDEAIAQAFTSGKINEIYSKWFEKPISPHDRNLQMPMSEGIKSLIANPSDKARNPNK